jgi:DnaJ domain
MATFRVGMDPFAVLGVAPGATAEELRLARRRLALRLHPDRAGGDAEAMRQLNTAFDQAMAERTAEAREGGRGPSADVSPAPPRRATSRLVHDVASFTIEALPAEAFEALLVVSTWLGEVLVDEPPYQLDVALAEPFDCWCRLDLVPDAGASTVSLTIAALPDEPLPDIDDVRDLWVESLNRLGRS